MKQAPPQTLGATAQNLLPRTTWSSVFVHACFKTKPHFYPFCRFLDNIHVTFYVKLVCTECDLWMIEVIQGFHCITLTRAGLRADLSLQTLPMRNNLKTPYDSLISQSVFRQVHSLFQSEFPRVHSNASSFNFQHPLVSLSHPVASYVFFLVFPSLLPILLFFLQYCVSEDISYARCDQSKWPFFFLLCIGHSSPPWLYVTLPHFSHDRSSWISKSFSSTSRLIWPKNSRACLYE